jgi:uncharacterized protein YaiI (UPF0178 family)
MPVLHFALFCLQMVRPGTADASFSEPVPRRVFLAIWVPMGYDAPHGSARRTPPEQPSTDEPALNATRIYVDADACPVKDEIYRVAARHALPVSVVAGQFIRVPADPAIERIAAGSGMDAADDWIAERAGKGDIVITSDIPLASRCVKAGAEVIAPNGKPFTEQSIGMTLAVRNLMTDLRSSGEVTGGPKSFAARDRSAFLSALDQTIRRIARQRAELTPPQQS